MGLSVSGAINPIYDCWSRIDRTGEFIYPQITQITQIKKQERKIHKGFTVMCFLPTPHMIITVLGYILTK